MKKYRINFLFKDSFDCPCTDSVESDCFEELKKLAIQKIKKLIFYNFYLETKDIDGSLIIENKYIGNFKYYLDPYFYEWNGDKRL